MVDLGPSSTDGICSFFRLYGFPSLATRNRSFFSDRSCPTSAFFRASASNSVHASLFFAPNDSVSKVDLIREPFDRAVCARGQRFRHHRAAASLCSNAQAVLQEIKAFLPWGVQMALSAGQMKRRIRRSSCSRLQSIWFAAFRRIREVGAQWIPPAQLPCQSRQFDLSQ